MKQGFKARLAAGETLHGTMLNLPSPAVAEILAAAGFDWLFVDAEHGPIDTGELIAILQAVDRDLACLVRVPELNAGAIKRALDAGAAGVIVPQIETAAAAADAVRLSRYAPEGSRGVGLSRAQRYGFAFKKYLEQANDEIVVVVQAEHVRAVENIEAIAHVAGLDAVFLGPYDLSASLGHPGEIGHPRVLEAIEHVTATCRAAGVPLGYFGMDAAAVAAYVEQGYTLICAGVDCDLLGQGARRLLEALQA
jgi:2-dehydro-3-deoxyglucarate aldolase